MGNKFISQISSKRCALALAIGMTFSMGAWAQSNTTGSVFGQARSGDKVLIENAATGFKREITVGADGNYRVSALPTGTYKVTATSADGTSEVRDAVNVNVGTGTSVSFTGSETELATVNVSGLVVNPIDVSSVESSTILTELVLDRMPVARDVTSVALLAPGTTKGDSAFGNLASFGGATVGENAYFINGFNVTNFRNGLGGSTVPFEFYQEFQVKTGGYGSEFGRSTGGVINTVTKRGTNDFEAGANFYTAPGGLRENNPCVDDRDGDRLSFGCNQDFGTVTEANVFAGGAIIEDRLFAYGLYQVRDYNDSLLDARGPYQYRNDDPFWGVKVDWNITDDHSLEYTGFSDSRDIIEDDSAGRTTFKRGGRNDIFRYTGYLSNSFTLSALYGKGSYELTNQGDGDACPLILDGRAGGALVPLGCYTTDLPSAASDERIAKRIDAEWSMGTHRLRFGIDREENSSFDFTQYSGGVYYRYYAATATLPERARVRYYQTGGNFNTNSSAYYIEDNWNVTDNLLLSLGIRNEGFDNRNANDDTFAELTNQWAPRLGLSWDMDGDGSKKLFANAGRYHLPVAANTNVRLAGGELFTEQFFRLNGLNADSTPMLGASLGPISVFGDGEIKDPRTIVDQNLKPMYQDEFILGYQMDLGNNWTGGVRGVHRDLKSTIEDVAIDAALNAYARAQNISADVFDAGGFDYYVLTNPGQDMLIYVDIDGDGTLDAVNLTAEQLGYPESTRKYNAVEFFFERSWDEKFFLQGSYTWAHSYGNNEGYVRSDNGQDDAGLTTLFDQPGLLDGAYGNLPNDVRHQIKVFGMYQLSDEWQVSGNALFKTGRPINCFGNHPTDDFAEAYGSESFYCGGQLVPRGSKGETDNQFNFDLGFAYKPAWGKDHFTARLDIFNLFNSHTVTEVNEVGEEGHAPETFPRPAYLTPTAFQAPRWVRLSFSYDW